LSNLGKSLLPEDVRGAYHVQPWHFPAWSKTLVEVLRRFNLRKGGIARRWRERISDLARDDHRLTATDYSRMNYEQLRKIADNDIVAANMSNEEYEALSTAMWRKFSVENGLR
jgi:hypothetical protein